MSNQYSLILHTPQELSQSSYVHTGLFEIQKSNGLKLTVKLSFKKRLGRLVFDTRGMLYKNSKSHPKTSVYTLKNKITGKSSTFAIDLYDHANDFSEYALKHCDFYFKRNYESKYVDKLPSELKASCLPLGLSFRVTSEDVQSNFKIRLGYMLSTLNAALKFDRLIFWRLFNKTKAINLHLKSHKSNRIILSFEKYNPNTKIDSILFQTRCFPDESNPDILAINQQRYRLIHVLREAFPKHFNGGFVPSDIVNRKYKDAITNVPTAPEDYLQFMKQSGIVIYTRGLANSPAWKMAEYLSQAKVIIAEKMTTELPTPLIDGKEVLFFDSEKSLIAQINKVLSDSNFCAELSKNARRYFEKHVHPKENIKRILDVVAPKNT